MSGEYFSKDFLENKDSFFLSTRLLSVHNRAITTPISRNKTGHIADTFLALVRTLDLNQIITNAFKLTL